MNFYRFLLVSFILILSACIPACYQGDDEETGTDTGDPFGIPIDNMYDLPGLKDDVEVLVDEWGIPHIYARNDHDALYMQGYMAARDRFVEMDLARMLSQGRIGEIIGELPFVGPLVASFLIDDVDLYYRTVFLGRDGVNVVEHLYNNLNDENLATLKAFSDGVSAYIRDMRELRNDVQLAANYTGLINVDPDLIEPWTVRDTLSVLMTNLYTASNYVSLEIDMAAALVKMGPGKFSDFFRAEPLEYKTILPNGSDDITPSVKSGQTDSANLEAVAEVLAQAIGTIDKVRESAPYKTNSMFQQGFHSNCWAVDGDHAAGGFPLMANDPHLGLLGPPYFWLVHVDSKTLGNGSLRFAGLGFPAAPGVQIGHNDAIGWTGTNANYDTVDAYIEELNPDNHGEVMFNGQPVAIKAYPQTFYRDRARGKDEEHPVAPVKKNVYMVPHHGPLLNDSCEDGYCMSLRWAGQEAGDEINAFIDILTAQNVDEGLEAFHQYRRGPYNWIVADTTGRIGYMADVEMPIRQNWKKRPPFLPLDGRGGNEWYGVVPDEDIARYVDPPEGFIATANNDIYGTVIDNNPLNDPYYYYYYVDIGFRAERIVNLLSGETGDINPDAVTIDDMVRIQNDTYSLFGRRFLDALFDAAKTRPEFVDDKMNMALGYLEGWDFSTPAAEPDAWRPNLPGDLEVANSIACALFHIWFGKVARMTYYDEFRRYGLEMPGDGSESGPQFEARALDRLLREEQFTYWGDRWWNDSRTTGWETREDILLTALSRTIEFFEKEIGPEMSEWTWGKVHTIEFGLTFEGLTLPSLIAPVLGPAAADGGNFTVNVANTWGLGYEPEVSHAPAARMVMEIDGDRFESWAVVPGGQSEDPGNLHYDDQFDEYLNGNLVPVYFTKEEIVPVTEKRIRYSPEQY